MNTFLQEVAKGIYLKHTNNLNEVLILMPNRRSCLYLQEHFIKLIDKNVSWLPEIVSFKDWVCKHSALTLADEIVLLFELYQSFSVKELVKSFDEFIQIGKILLNDFNEIDAELVDVEKFFKNIADLEQIQELFSIEDEIKNILEIYKQIIINKSLLDKHHLIRKNLFEIYSNFTKTLISKNLAYDGLLWRYFLEKEIDSITIEDNVYAVGFNVLTKSEQEILQYLANRKKLTYLWDYDEFYIQNELIPAGKVLREQIKKHPNPSDFNISVNNFNNTIIQAFEFDNESMQVKYALNLLVKNSEEQYEQTALVLTDESLLPLVLHTLPEKIEKVNVTMGFSIKHTHAFSFIRLIYDWISKGNDNILTNYLLNIFYHPYIFNESWAKEWIENNKVSLILNPSAKNKIPEKIFPLLFDKNQDIFTFLDRIKEFYSITLENIEKEKNIHNEIEKQAINKIIETIHFFKLSCSKSLINFEKLQTGIKVLLQILSGLKVDLIGEPIEGLQIMGLMETRLLDFKRVLVLSLSEENLPRKHIPATFILHSFRVYYNLTTNARREVVDAYHFYRLLQRSQEVYLCYANFTNNKPVDKSPYIRQLDFFDKIKDSHKASIPFVFDTPLKNIQIEKRQIYQQWNEFYQNLLKKGLSRHEFSEFVTCKLRFALRCILKLEMDDIFIEPQEQIELGNALDNIIKNLLNNKNVTINDLQNYLNNIEPEINKFFQAKPNVLYTSIQKVQVLNLLKKFFNSENEKEYRSYPLEILNNGQNIESTIQIDEQKIKLTGIPDLIVKNSNNYIYIIDLKLSKSDTNLNLSSVDDFFSGMKKYIYPLQLLYYSYIFYANNKNYQHIYLENIFLNKADEEGIIKVANKEFNLTEHIADVETAIQSKLREMLNEELIFTQTEDKKNCKNCKFNIICKKI
ncbi:MAG: PD-(D/E)XK nuclease family protein [Bacteroidales bacterium]|nr:PD-(D/E)XK nuclease family protein [Bacteroidales bacterium]